MRRAIIFPILFFSYANAIDTFNRSISFKESIAGPIDLSTMIDKLGSSVITSAPRSSDYYDSHMKPDFVDQESYFEIGKRDDMAFLLKESVHDEIQRAYATLESDALDISPEERLLRVASAFVYSGTDEGGWASQWAQTHDWSARGAELLPAGFFQFAFDATYGSLPLCSVKSWLQNFDKQYRCSKHLPTTEYEPLTQAKTQSTLLPEFLKSYLQTRAFASRVKMDSVWRSYSGKLLLPSTAFCTQSGTSTCTDEFE